jgi:hypothetical protein
MSEPRPGRASFTPWFWSYRLAARLEALVVICVFAGVIFIMGYLLQMPGPLVVHLQDDAHEPVKNARVRCTSPDGATSYAGLTDVFGEAKWPGLAKGLWKCEVTPPDRFHAGTETGFATVAARHPAIWNAMIERPTRILAEIQRPTGAPRAAVAVRAICEEAASSEQQKEGARPMVATWEARAGLLDGRALLFVPHGKTCRIGLVRAELPYDGPVTSTELDCEHQPCRAGLTGGVNELLSARFAPTREQWDQIRPPPEPDKPDLKPNAKP